MKSLRMFKINWLVIVIILIAFLTEYHFLSDAFERKSVKALKSDLQTVVSGVSGLANNFEYGASITKYRVETLSRQMLRYNINYVDEKIIGVDAKDPIQMADSVRRVMESNTWDPLIIMGLYDHQRGKFLLSEGYFEKASALPVKDLKDLIKSAMVKDEAFESFPLGKNSDLFNRIDVFARYNPSAGVTVLGAIPRATLKEAYEDNVDFGQLRSELMAHHSPENEGYILLYDQYGKLLTENWKNNGDEVFLHNSKGQSLYDLAISHQEEVITYQGSLKDNQQKTFYAYADRSGGNLIVVVKEKSVADRHKEVVEIILKFATVLMMMLMVGIIYLVHDAKPEENVFN